MITNTVRRDRHRRSSRRSECSAKEPDDFKSKYYDSAEESSPSSADGPRRCGGGCRSCKMGAVTCGDACTGKDDDSLVFCPKTSPCVTPDANPDSGVGCTLDGRPMNEIFQSARMAVDSMQVALEALNTKLDNTHRTIDEVTTAAKDNSRKVKTLLRKMNHTERLLDKVEKRAKRKKQTHLNKSSPLSNPNSNSPKNCRLGPDANPTNTPRPTELLRSHNCQNVDKFEQKDDSKPNPKSKTNPNTQFLPKPQPTPNSNLNPKPNPATTSRGYSKSPSLRPQTVPKPPKPNPTSKSPQVPNNRAPPKPPPIQRTRPPPIPNFQTTPKPRNNPNIRQNPKHVYTSPPPRGAKKNQHSKKSQPASNCNPIENSDGHILTATNNKYNSTGVGNPNSNLKPNLVNTSTSTSVPSVLLASVCLSSEKVSESPRVCRSAFVQTFSDLSDLSPTLSSPFHSHPSILEGYYGRSNPGPIIQAVERHLNADTSFNKLLSNPLCPRTKSSTKVIAPHPTDSSKILIHTVIIESCSHPDVIPMQYEETCLKSDQGIPQITANPVYSDSNFNKTMETYLQHDSTKELTANFDGCSQPEAFSMQPLEYDLKLKAAVSKVVPNRSNHNRNIIENTTMPSKHDSVNHPSAEFEGCQQSDAISLQSSKKRLNSNSTKMKSKSSHSDSKSPQIMLTQKRSSKKHSEALDSHTLSNTTSTPSTKKVRKSNHATAQPLAESFNFDSNVIQTNASSPLPHLSSEPAMVLEDFSHQDAVPTQTIEESLKSGGNISRTESKSSEVNLTPTTKTSCNNDYKKVQLLTSSILIGTTNLEGSFSQLPKEHETHSSLSPDYHKESTPIPMYSDVNDTLTTPNPPLPHHRETQPENNSIENTQITSLNPFANAKEQIHQDSQSFKAFPSQEVLSDHKVSEGSSSYFKSQDTSQENTTTNTTSSKVESCTDGSTETYSSSLIAPGSSLPNAYSRSSVHDSTVSENVSQKYGSPALVAQTFHSQNVDQTVSQEYPVPEYVPPNLSFCSLGSYNRENPNPFLQKFFSPAFVNQETLYVGFPSEEITNRNLVSQEGNPPSDFLQTASDHPEQPASSDIDSVANFVPQEPQLTRNLSYQELLSLRVISQDHPATRQNSSGDLVLGKELLKAAYEGRSMDVATLLSAGADVNFTWGSKWTPLHRAAWGGHADVITILACSGADVNARTVYGFTALHIAAYNDASGACVEELLSAGADVDARNQMGWTALHYAAESGRKDTVESLMKAGANKELRSNRGKMPYHVARTQGIKKLLASSSE